ncbi:BamA/TamA family outer membrane protein [Flavobacterium sp. GNP001]
MKNNLALLLFLLCTITMSAQSFYIKFKTATTENQTLPDTLLSLKKHTNLQSIEKRISTISQQLIKKGFLDSNIQTAVKINDSVYSSTIYFGDRIKSVVINAPNNFEIPPFSKTKKTHTIDYEDLDQFLSNILSIYEQQGNALANIRLKNIERQKNLLQAELEIYKSSSRKLTNIIVEQANNLQLPKSLLSQIKKKYLTKTYNKETLSNIYNQFEKLGFAKNSKYPEALLTTDSTAVYVYLEKQNANTFDGFIGFRNNDAQKIQLNGYANIELQNILKRGEKIQINWKSDGQDQKTFDASVVLPFIFNSPIGLKTELNLFRQDSTFQNTKTMIAATYEIKSRQIITVGYQTTTSNDIQNINSVTIQDYSNSFLTIGYKYEDTTKRLNNTEPNQLSVNFDLGKRDLNNTANPETQKQFSTSINWTYNITLSQKNNIIIQSNSYLLRSKNILQNELYRFGGFNSLRGFNENSLQASMATVLKTEFRTTLNTQLYFHSILDYSLAKDKSSSLSSNSTRSRLGTGFGIGLQTSNGLLRLAFANGATLEEKFNFQNSIIHLSYNVKF